MLQNQPVGKGKCPSTVKVQCHPTEVCPINCEGEWGTPVCPDDCDYKGGKVQIQFHEKKIARGTGTACPSPITSDVDCPATAPCPSPCAGNWTWPELNTCQPCGLSRTTTKNFNITKNSIGNGYCPETPQTVQCPTTPPCPSPCEGSWEPVESPCNCNTNSPSGTRISSKYIVSKPAAYNGADCADKGKKVESPCSNCSPFFDQLIKETPSPIPSPGPTSFIDPILTYICPTPCDQEEDEPEILAEEVKEGPSATQTTKPAFADIPDSTLAKLENADMDRMNVVDSEYMEQEQEKKAQAIKTITDPAKGSVYDSTGDAPYEGNTENISGYSTLGFAEFKN